MELMRISETAQTILDTVYRVFTENGVPLPERRYLAIGDAGKTAHDGEQVTVSFGSVSEGLPYNNMPVLQRCSEPFHGFFTVEIVRCSPAPRKSGGGLSEVAPKAETIHDYSVTRMTDAWLLVEVAKQFGDQVFTEKVGYNVSFGDDSGTMQAAILTINTVV